jgi:adenylate cyclase
VEVHADILRTILSGWSVQPAGLGWDLLAIAAAGLAVTAVASCCGALRAAALATVGLVVLLAGNAWVLFAWAGVSLAVAAPAGAMVGSFLVVTAYRQLTEERARRRIRRMFSHAVSPEVAEELMRNPSLASVGGQRREISCLFSDLGGFTDLSGRIGSRATVRLLNRYFDEVTDAVQHVQQGYLNKFLGDGVLALFGAPLDQSDHATRAIQAAADCHRRVAELNRELAANPESPPGELKLRAGVAAGEAMVGNCGSSERMDYTAIGDCVNLASRLETACKFFGAKLLVSAEAWKQAAVELPARPLGPLWITGVDRPVEVHEVLVDDVPTADELSHFAQGVEHLRRERLGEAAEAFESLTARRPTDRAVAVFAGVARALVDGEEPAGRAGNGTVRVAWPGSEGFASA